VRNGVVIALMLIAASIGLALTVAARLSDQAIAALAGAACGIGLAAPLGIALGVTVGISRAPSRTPPASPPPQVVVIPASTHPIPNGVPHVPMPAALAQSSRSFTIIGEGEDS